MKKRVLSIFLSVCMVLSLMPAFTLTASAGTITIDENQTKEDGDLLITEDTTINIEEGITYTVPNIIFQNGDGNQKLTITGGGTLKVYNQNGDGKIESIDKNITIDIIGAKLTAGDIMPGQPMPPTQFEQDIAGIDGYDVTIKVDGDSTLNCTSITGGMGSNDESRDVTPPESDPENPTNPAPYPVYAYPGNGGDVNLTINSGVAIVGAVKAGDAGSNVTSQGQQNKGKLTLEINGGYFESEPITEASGGSSAIIRNASACTGFDNSIHPTDGTSPVYPVTISVPTNSAETYLSMTYSLDGGAEISTKAKEKCLNLWLTEETHKLIVSDSNKKMYSAEFTVTSGVMSPVAALPIPLAVKNGDTTSYHETWAEAIQAVATGGTITIMEDQVPFDGFPEVDCTIEGVLLEDGEYTKINPNSSPTINMKSNIILKNIRMGLCLSDPSAFLYLATGEPGGEGHLLTVEGDVNLNSDLSIKGENLTGSKLIVNGDLYCYGIYGFETVKNNSGSSIETAGGRVSTKNLINDGEISTKLCIEILGGTLSGNGTLEFSGGFLGGRLQFKNGSKIASDSAIALEANFYTPAEDDLIAINIPNEGVSPSKVENIEKLRFDSSDYGDLMLAGSVDTANNRYQYRLAPAMSEVINGVEVTHYASWEEAVEAVESGGTIKLLNSFVYQGDQINMPMPDVEFTIDGGGYDFTTSDVYPNANISLKDVNLTNGTFYGKDINGNPRDINIEGSVTGSSIGFSGIATGSSINISGNLICNKIENFNNVIIGQNGKLEAKECKAKNYEINGELVYPEYGKFAIDGGVLSGTGDIDIKGSYAPYALAFYNMASIGENSEVTIRTNTINVTLLGMALIYNNPILENTTSTAILNIERLKMGAGIDPLKLEVADGMNFAYRLKAARTFTLENKTVPYTGQEITIEATAISPELNGEQIEYKFYKTEEDRQAEVNGTTSAINAGAYYVRAKIPSTDSCLAKYEDATLTITKAAGLEAPTNGSVDDTANTFTFTPVSGQETLDLYEYSFDGNSWILLSEANASTSQAGIIISVGNVSGTIKVRLAESSNYEAGNILTANSAFTGTLEGQANVSGSVVYGHTLTANVSGMQAGSTLSYQWKKTINSVTTDIGTGNTYTLVSEDIGATITVEVTAQEYTGSLSSTPTPAVAKAPAASTPSAPSVASIETETISLTSNAAYQYRLGSGNWQDSNIFSGLAPATGYEFFSRIKETATSLPSEASEGKIIYTKSAAPIITAAAINYLNETISFDLSKYEMNTASGFDGSSISNESSISNYFGQNLYIRVKAVLNGAPESASTQISIPQRPAAPSIINVEKELEGSLKITATVSSGGINNLYRVNHGAWQDSTVFTGLSIGEEHTFEVKQKAAENLPASETALIKKTWNSDEFTAAEIASKIVSITAPAQNATSLTLPAVPPGFTAGIKTVTPDTSVVTTGGAITPPAAATTVNIVLTVKKTSDSTEADTQALQVIVPAKSVSGNGGKSSSGGGGSAVIQPSNNGRGNISVTAKTSGNGVMEAAVSSDQIKDAVAAVSKNSEKELVIKINTNPGVNNLSLGIPQAAIGEAIKGNIDELKISSNTANLTFDKESLAKINKNLSGDLSINMEKLDTASLSKDAQEKIKDRPVYDFTVKSGDKTISEFGGNVKVEVPYTLKAGENPNSIVIFYIDDNGELTEVPNCVYNQATGMVSFITNHFSKYAVLYNEVRFNDVSGWYADYVNFLAARNIIKGTGANTFSPEKNITRAEFVTILANLSGQKLSGNHKSQFSDVSETDWYFEEVQWAYENKIITGTNGKFNPKETIIRQDMALILARYAEYVAKYKLPETTTALNFTDSDLIASYTIEAVKAMQNAGIISGNSDGSFAPKANATRAQTAKMITVLIKNMAD